MRVGFLILNLTFFASPFFKGFYFNLGAILIIKNIFRKNV